jgi:hypothetical protein
MTHDRPSACHVIDDRTALPPATAAAASSQRSRQADAQLLAPISKTPVQLPTAALLWRGPALPAPATQ